MCILSGVCARVQDRVGRFRGRVEATRDRQLPPFTTYDTYDTYDTCDTCDTYDTNRCERLLHDHSSVVAAKTAAKRSSRVASTCRARSGSPPASAHEPLESKAGPDLCSGGASSDPRPQQASKQASKLPAPSLLANHPEGNIRRVSKACVCGESCPFVSSVLLSMAAMMVTSGPGALVQFVLFCDSRYLSPERTE